ncbi:bifunctional polymyxin resistance protein ArnA [mine drainage metagenome]|uniref:Bifunctional polymyxin resistance protein ArnA n=1 Tax=mine drainage metagenome TaxID=410659 RepID=A0A1J5RXP4_9ZZZZ
MTRAVVFAYHNVGVRCLSVLLAHGIEVALVVTHQDNPLENVWFDSVAELAALHDIPAITPADPNDPEIVAQISKLSPDFLFSFYYRLMIKRPLLELPRGGAYNMHGSLLPKYRGRVPVNWAVLAGERETGATLHRMLEKPDAGAILAQQAIPILPDDSAFEVFNKVTVAAEIALDRVLPQLVAGTAIETPQDLAQGSYFGGRKPEDGRINWHAPARSIHNLVRAVAPPYPGAFSAFHGGTLRVGKSLVEPRRAPRPGGPGLYAEDGNVYADCGDGGVLRLVVLEFGGEALDAAGIVNRFGPDKLLLS